MKTPLAIAACTLFALGGAGLTAAEISGDFGDDTVDEHVVREPVQKVVIDAEDGDVTLDRSVDDVHVRVKRNHLINTPSPPAKPSGSATASAATSVSRRCSRTDRGRPSSPTNFRSTTSLKLATR